MASFDKTQISLKDTKKIALVGNPNVGKSVVFNILTGKYAMVSNYPGTTVEVYEGLATFDKKTSIIDTPGINSLIPQSEDERVTRDILIEEKPAVLVQVADGKNLRRALFLTIQLLEMELPLILDLNMSDEARQRGIKIDTNMLKSILGIDVIETVATEKQGIAKLIDCIQKPKEDVKNVFKIDYPQKIQNAVEAISGLLPPTHISKKAVSLMLLSGDQSIKPKLLEKGLSYEGLKEIEREIENAQSDFNFPLSYIINKKLLENINTIIKKVHHDAQLAQSKDIYDFLGRIMMSPVWGMPILILVLYLLYKFVGQFAAGTLVDFMENIVFRKFFNPAIETFVNSYIKLPLVPELLVGKYGLITMGLTYSIAIVLPIMTCFFLAFGILEDSGYLPRLTVMANKIFKRIGLHGKAVLPMVLGLGCGTMAVLTARILDTKKERLIATLLIGLAIPCSAQLGVIMAMLGAISIKALLILFGVVAGVLLIVGFFAKLIIPGETSDFLIEIPPVRVPIISNVLIKTKNRIKWFLKEAMPLFLLGTVLLFIFDKTGLLTAIENILSPVVTNFLQLPKEATAAFVLGFLRRDYGAAGLYQLAKNGMLTNVQIVVSMTVITLFVPCIANFFVIIKEQGLKRALSMLAFITPTAILVGGILNFILRQFNVRL